MDGFAEKVLIALIGALIGWGLKAATDFLSAQRQAYRALWRFEAELQTLRVQVNLANEHLNQAKHAAIARSKEAEEKLTIATSLARALPPLDTYSSRFDDLAAAFTTDELDLVRERVSYYTAMRSAFPETMPEAADMFPLEAITNVRRRLLKPFIWLTKPRLFMRLRREARRILADDATRQSRLQKQAAGRGA